MLYKKYRACVDPACKICIGALPLSCHVLVAEYLTQMGPLSVVLPYAPTNQSNAKDKETLIG